MHAVFTRGMQLPKTVARQSRSVHSTQEAPEKHTWGVTVKLKGADVDPTSEAVLEGVYVAMTVYCPAGKG